MKKLLVMFLSIGLLFNLTVFNVSAETNEERIEELSISQSQKSVIMNAKVADTDSECIFFALAEFNDDKFINLDYEYVNATNNSAQATLTLNNVTDSNVVKAFIWTDDLKPIKNIYNFKTQLTVSPLNELYGNELDKNSFDALSVTEFYNNKKAAVSVTFDDGFLDAAQYYDELFTKYNMHGTAFLVANWIKESEIPSWKALFEKGNIDLGNHSKSHAVKYAENPTQEALETDITGGWDSLKKIFPEQKIMTFAAPWTHKTDASTAEMLKHHYANRGGGTGFVSSNPTQETLNNLPGYVIYNTYTAAELNAKIDQAISNKQWFIYLMHGIGTGTYNIDKQVCADNFAYIGSKSEDVWAGSMQEVVQYIKEKQNAIMTTNWVREKAISISVTDTLDDALFDFPLTIKMNVPANWQNVKVTTSNGVINTKTQVENQKTYVYVNVVPDSGDVIIESI